MADLEDMIAQHLLRARCRTRAEIVFADPARRPAHAHSKTDCGRAPPCDAARRNCTSMSARRKSYVLGSGRTAYHLSSFSGTRMQHCSTISCAQSSDRKSWGAPRPRQDVRSAAAPLSLGAAGTDRSCRIIMPLRLAQCHSANPGYSSHAFRACRGVHGRGAWWLRAHRRKAANSPSPTPSPGQVRRDTSFHGDILCFGHRVRKRAARRRNRFRCDRG